MTKAVDVAVKKGAQSIVEMKVDGQKAFTQFPGIKVLIDLEIIIIVSERVMENLFVHPPLTCRI